MKKVIPDIPIEFIIDAYKQLKSSYKVSKKFNISATVVKRILKEHNSLRNQSQAAKERKPNPSYIRTEQHKLRLSELGKTRIKEKNPFYNKKHSVEVRKKLSEYAKTRTKNRNPNYKTGEYQRRPRDFKQSEFTKLRNFVFNRDDYTCYYCKYIGGHLHAHHKIPYWINSKAFLDTDNLITVCTNCHFNKAHLGNWTKFDISLIDERLIKRYSLDRERLNESGTIKSSCDSPFSMNNSEYGETGRNDLSTLKKV